MSYPIFQPKGYIKLHCSPVLNFVLTCTCEMCLAEYVIEQPCMVDWGSETYAMGLC